MLDAVAARVNVPIIASGGAGKKEDLSLIHISPHIAQRLGERLPQRDAHILGGVVVIHLHVPVAGEDVYKRQGPWRCSG